MSDFSDTSYYEIALTNRQVVVAFVILLTMVLAVFLCGVWVGQNGQQRIVQSGPAAGEEAAPAELANMEEFKFFEEQANKEELDKPDLGTLLENPRRDTTLAQDVGSREAAPREAAPREAAPREAAPRDPAPRQTSPPPAPPDSASTSQTSTSPAPTSQTPNAQTSPPRAAAPPREDRPSPARETAPAPAPAASPPAARSPAAGAESFVVQVFSTHDEPQARKLLGRLEGLGHRAFLSTIDVGGQTMFRVRVGPFSQRSAAERVKGQVRNQLELDPWVTAASN